MNKEHKLLKASELLDAPYDGFRLNHVFPMIQSKDLTIANALLKPFAVEHIIESERLYDMVKSDIMYCNSIYYGDDNEPSDTVIYRDIYSCTTICRKCDLELRYIIAKDPEYGFLFTEIIFDNRTGLFYDAIVEDNYSSEYIYLSSTFELF